MSYQRAKSLAYGGYMTTARGLLARGLAYELEQAFSTIVYEGCIHGDLSCARDAD